MAPARNGGARHRRLRRATAEPRHRQTDPRRVRPHRQVVAGTPTGGAGAGIDIRLMSAPGSTTGGVLDLDENELVACVACGLCLPHCPTYRVTGLETASPRGRIAAMKAVQFGGAPIDESFERFMEECIQCRGCEAACPSSVRFGPPMEGAPEAPAQERAAP